MDFSGGVDGSRPPWLLDPDQSAFAVNATFRGGPATQRPAFRKLSLTFANSSVAAAFQFPTGPFQHARNFDGAGVPTLISSQAGRQFMLDLTNNTVSEITPLASGGGLDINDPTAIIGWSEQVENYWVFQDNQSLPIIFDGSRSLRSSQSANQIPVGNVMCYTQGRLAVALPDRFSFRIGDLVFGASGTQQNQHRDAPLYFTENTYLNEGGDFQARVYGAPSNFGPILSMKAGAMTDTSLGQGPLLIGQPYMVFSVQLPFDRTQWKNLAQAMQTANPVNGPLGQDSTVLINTDMWYRRIDGIGSYVTAQRQFNGSWINTPNSSEIGDVLDADTMELLESGSGVLFGNRLLETISPVNSPYGIYHRGLASLDFNLVSTMRKKLNPAWEGIWTGLNIFKIVKCIVNRKERCFMYVLNPCTNGIEVWEVRPDLLTDEGDTPIRWRVDLRSMVCGAADEFKRLETARINLTDVVGLVNGTITYRSDENPCPQPWDTFTVCAARQDCGPYKCTGPSTYRAQARIPIDLFMPPDTFDPTAHKQYRTAYQYQPIVDITGSCSLESFRIYAVDQPESLSARRGHRSCAPPTVNVPSGFISQETPIGAPIVGEDGGIVLTQS